MKYKLQKSLSCISMLILLLFTAMQLNAQNLTVKGKIVDQIGEGVIGATVQVAGTTNGTITDIDGNFTITCPSSAKLNISYIGYKSQSISVNGKTFFDIKLQEDSQVLEDVVVVGYGVQRKSDLTGAVGSVKMGDALKSMPVANATDALQGRLAGVNIINASGAPNSDAVIRVRGLNSFQADAGPLVVIDGFTGGSIKSLNPSDILSVEVLKDASATAVYGSRGANGVILITTKNPEKGKFSIDYSGYVNMKTTYNMPEMLSPGQFADLANEYAASREANPYYTAEQVADFYNGRAGFDYMKATYRDLAIQTVHELSISGGSDKVRFLFSGSYNYDEGTVAASSAQRANYRLKVDADPFKWLKVGANFWGDFSVDQGPRVSQYRGVLIESLIYPNTIAPRDENGNYNNRNLTGQIYNPLGHIEEVYKDGYRTNNYLQGFFDITFCKGLTFRMLQGVKFANTMAHDVNGKQSYNAWAQGYTSSSSSSNATLDWTNTNILSYVREFNENHRINATLVFEQMYSNTRKLTTSAQKLLNEDVGLYNVAFAELTDGKGDYITNSIMSGLARINYALMNRYMFTLSYRMDGSSRLAKGNQWDGFFAGAVAWDIRNEPFFEPATQYVDQMKFRFGYGETGNQAVAPYSAFSEYEATHPNGELKLAFKRRGNSALRWERTSQYNVGLDLGFFNNRLTLNADWYYKMSNDVLLNVDEPAYSGFPDKLSNAASILNTGIEITIGGDPFVGKDFRWNTQVTLTHNATTIEDLANGKEFITLKGNYEEKHYRYIKGEKVGSLYGHIYEGVWTTDEVNAGLAPEGTAAGAYKYKDITKDGQITDADQTVIGNGQPVFNWGWNNTLSYKDFDFGLFMIGYHGFDIYNFTRQSRTYEVTPLPDLVNRWKPGTNENAKVAGFIQDDKRQNYSSQFVEKGDFVKIKSITVGYSLPKKVLEKCHLTKFRFYASVQNPFVITSYTGMDPEVALKDPLKPGIDYGYYPNGRNYLIGLNIAF